MIANIFPARGHFATKTESCDDRPFVVITTGQFFGEGNHGAGAAIGLYRKILSRAAIGSHSLRKGQNALTAPWPLWLPHNLI